MNTSLRIHENSEYEYSNKYSEYILNIKYYIKNLYFR